MMIKNNNWVGFQCPACGNIQILQLKIFELSGNMPYELCCNSCHKRFAVIDRYGRDQYQIKTSCVDCFNDHIYKVKIGEFWLASHRAFRCTQSNDPIMVTGNVEYVKKSLECMFLDLEDGEEVDEWDDSAPGPLLGPYTSNPEAISALGFRTGILQHFKLLAGEGKVGCKCGEKYLQMKFEYNTIQVICPTCGRSATLDVSTPEEAEAIIRLPEFYLT